MKADLVKQQIDDMSRYRQDMFMYRPHWEAYKDTLLLTWTSVKLETTNRVEIPDDCGIYSLLVQPGIANHPAASYLMYVGQTVSLNRRFGEYFLERRIVRRPLIFRLMNLYPNHIWFCFTRVPESKLSQVEDSLLTAFIPPANSLFPATIKDAVRAFR